MPKLCSDSKGDANPGFLDCESDILPLSNHAPINMRDYTITKYKTHNITSNQLLGDY